MGNDSNADRTGSGPATGDSGGISVSSTGMLSLDLAVVRYGGKLFQSGRWRSILPRQPVGGERTSRVFLLGAHFMVAIDVTCSEPLPFASLPPWPDEELPLPGLQTPLRERSGWTSPAWNVRPGARRGAAPNRCARSIARARGFVSTNRAVAVAPGHCRPLGLQRCTARARINR